MNKAVKEVRKSITERKKKRGITSNSNEVTTKSFMPSLPEDEEKHGYYPSFFDINGQRKHKSNVISSLVLKGILSVMLFFGVALLYESEMEVLNQPKEWTSNALTEEFPFANVYVWYQDTFGTPLAFSPTPNYSSDTAALAYPVNGSVTESFQSNGKGIMIAPEEETMVSALREGVVIFSGNDRLTDKTVVIQHADGSKSTYGLLSDIDVHLYQYISANQRIGQFSPSAESETVYFSIEKDNQYIDPVQVIKVDDSP